MAFVIIVDVKIPGVSDYFKIFSSDKEADEFIEDVRIKNRSYHVSFRRLPDAEISMGEFPIPDVVIPY